MNKKLSISLSDISYEMAYLFSISLSDVRDDIKEKTQKILKEEYGASNYYYLDYYLPYSHPRFTLWNNPELNEFPKLLKPHRFENLSDRIFGDKIETVDEKIDRLQEKLNLVVHQLERLSNNQDYKRIKFMLEIRLERLKNGLDDISIEEMRKIVRVSGYMNEAFESQLKRGMEFEREEKIKFSKIK